MAQINQLGGTALLEIAVHNYSTTTDLAEGVAVSLDTSNTGGANTAPGVILTASDVKPLGFLTTKIPFGKSGVCRVEGTAVAVAGGGSTIHVGDYLMTDSAGGVIPQTATHYQIGMALTEAVAADRVLVLIDRAKNA